MDWDRRAGLASRQLILCAAKGSGLPAVGESPLHHPGTMGATVDLRHGWCYPSEG